MDPVLDAVGPGDVVQRGGAGKLAQGAEDLDAVLLDGGLLGVEDRADLGLLDPPGQRIPEPGRLGVDFGREVDQQLVELPSGRMRGIWRRQGQA